MNIADTCEGDNITKIFLSSIIECKRRTAGSKFINKELREICILNCFEFIELIYISTKLIYGELGHTYINLV